MICILNEKTICGRVVISAGNVEATSKDVTTKMDKLQ